MKCTVLALATLVFVSGCRPDTGMSGPRPEAGSTIIAAPEAGSTIVGGIRIPEAGSIIVSRPVTENPYLFVDPINLSSIHEKDGVKLRVASWKEVERAVQANKGKVVVLDLWSTYCEPCMHEFPNLVELHQAYTSSKVACISVSLDFDGVGEGPDQESIDNVLDFLAKKKAKFSNFILNEDPDKLYEELDLAAIPAVYVFDRQGKQIKRFDNDNEEYGDDGFTYEDHIFPLVGELLAAE